MSGITAEMAAVLSAPFAASDHEFNRGFIYVTEGAICDRIETVDPSWQWVIVDMRFENDMASVIGALTINGVTRQGVGQQLAQIDKNGRESVGEARKGAATDAMKRAARLFGIGRYLLNCPDNVKNHGTALDSWLKSLNGEQPPALQQKAEPKQVSVSDFWEDLKRRFAERMNDANTARAIETMRQMYAKKTIDTSMSAGEIIDRVIARTFVDGELLEDDNAVAYFEKQAKGKRS